jgi:endoglucanase
VGQRGKFSYGEALQKNFLFFEANRSGALPKDNRLEWRSDSTTNDGKDVGRDLAGGYFDAGDHIKFIQPMAFSNTMLAWGGADYKAAYAQSGQLDELMEAVKWGTDWFLKAHEMDSSGKTERLWVQVGDKTDHNYWVSPEEIASKTARPSFAIDRQHPGSDAAAGTASALASAAVLFRGTDDAYADELIKNAEALYEFAETYKGKYSDSVPQASPFYTSWSGYNDELALGGAWLYRATGDSKYLSKAENYFKNNVGTLGDWTYATDDHSYGAATLLAKESSDPFFKQQTKNWLDTWVAGRGSVKYTSGGFAFRNNWASVPLDMSTAFAAEWYNDKVEANSKYSDFAHKQVDYVLGDNPAKFSYVVGFGDNYAKRTHHRGSADTAPLDGSDRPNDHLLYGAVVGGPGKVDDFSHNDRRNDWITNEVGTSYNAPFASAAIQQYENLGGDPLSESQLDQLIGIDANGTGF